MDTGDLEAKMIQRNLRELFENAEFSDALICHYFPQYRLEDVEELTHGEFSLLLRVAQSIELQRNMAGLNNAAAASSKQGYEKTMASYQKRLKELAR